MRKQKVDRFWKKKSGLAEPSRWIVSRQKSRKQKAAKKSGYQGWMVGFLKLKIYIVRLYQTRSGGTN
jgi:hypothetical protein